MKLLTIGEGLGVALGSVIQLFQKYIVLTTNGLEWDTAC